MKILYVSQYFPPEPGAPAARVSELCSAWAEAGHQVTVLTGMPNHPTGVVPSLYRGRTLVQEMYGKVQVVRSWIYAAANRGRIRRSFSYASFAASAVILGQWRIFNPEVVIATSPQFLCAVAGRIISIIKSAPFVFEVRDLWPESIVAVGAFPANHFAVQGLELLEKFLYQTANSIVVVTDAFQKRLMERGIPSQKIAVIKNGVDLNRFQPLPSQTKLRQRLGWEKDFVVAYVGTHGMAHGLNTVLEVASRLRERKDIRFLLVGEGAERRALELQARKKGLSQVVFLGALPREEINQVYATADVCLVPLRKNELFAKVIPSKIFEIMAMERPIILSVDGEARTLVESAGAGIFCPPEDADQMTPAILQLAGDSVLREKMGKAGRQFVSREFDRTVLAKKYLTVLESLVSSEK